LVTWEKPSMDDIISEGGPMAFVEVPVRPSRRRALVFAVAFLTAAAISLTYVYTLPAEYRTAARLQIVPASMAALSETDTKPTGDASFLTEVQVLTSRPLLTEVLDRLRSSDTLPYLGADPVAGAQRLLRAQPVAGTEIVVLTADGTASEFLAPLVNTVTDVYRERLAVAYKTSAANATTGVADEEKTLAQDAAAKQATLEAYRKRYDIVSLERNENAVLAKLNGLNTAYTDANTKLSAAEGALEAARKAAAAGEGAASAKNDPTLADMEVRASALREQKQDLLRQFTPDYLALDPNAKALDARLADLDKQIAERRVTSRQAAVATAQENDVAAKAAVDQLTREMAEAQHDAQDFATHLGEYKSMQQDLDHVEALHRDALDRLTQLQATVRQRAPQVAIVEAAAPPRLPWRPDYQTDALASLAGSLAFGLFAVLLGEFLAGPAPSPGISVRHSWVPTALGLAGPQPSEPALAAPGRLIELPAPPPEVRELSNDEVAALAAAGEDQRLACTALLMGLTEEELIAVRWDAVDLDGNSIRIAGASARGFALAEPLRGLVAARRDAQPEGAETLLHDANGAPLGTSDVARLVLYAAYDAGIERPQEITPAVLRHTYLAFLLRQGMRMSDLARVAGHIPQAELGAYAQIAGSGARLPFDEIERVLPALRGSM
jgi:polysaccharide biosynthesis transport protein